MKNNKSPRNRGSRRFVSRQKERKKEIKSNGRLEHTSGRYASGPKTKDNAIRAEGVVVESLPSGLFQVEMESQHQITAYIGGKLARNRIWVSPGDKVTLELSPYDLTRGRIVWRDSGRGQRRMPQERNS